MVSKLEHWLTKGRRLGLHSLRARIVIVLCAGLVVPALIGGLLLATFRQETIEREIRRDLDGRIRLLAESLGNPLWHFDLKEVEMIGDSAMLDSQLVSLKVESRETGAVLTLERPERRMGTVHTARQDVMFNGRPLGQVELGFDDGLMRQELGQDMRVLSLVLIGQFLFSLFLALASIRQRVLDPLERLTDFSNDLAAGNLARAIEWSRPDEIGQLAAQLDRMRRSLNEINSELERRVEQRTAELSLANADLARALSDLQRAQDELVRAEKLTSLGALVAGVAHELNTPIGNAFTLSSTLVDEQQAFSGKLGEGITRRDLTTFVDFVHEAGVILDRNLRRAADLIGNFKQLAVDQSSYQRRQFDLAEVINEVLMAMGPSLRRTPYVVRNEVPEGLRFDSYPGPLGQVLMNLINNALIHAFENREHGQVLITAEPIGDERVRLTVADDGRGISAEDQKRIFDPFFTTRLGEGGSGLGLHIVFNLVADLLGGSIEVNSAPGEGAAFVIYLPISPKVSKRLVATASTG